MQKLVSYFKTERTEEESVLVGYVARVLSKLMEVSSSEMIDFFSKNRELLKGIIKNVGDNSVAQFLITVLSDNFVVKEKKGELRTEELLKSRNLENSYGKGFDTRSKNKMFRDCSETLFECQKKHIMDLLEKGDILLLKEIIKEEILEYEGKLERGRLVLSETFKDLLVTARTEPVKTGNIVRVLFETLCKLLDVICDEVGIKGENTYMNRMNK